MRYALILSTLLLTANLAFAQPAATKLPDGLRHVPLDALGFIHFRVGDFLGNDIGKQLLIELQNDKEAAKALKKLDRELGLQISTIDSVTLLMLRPPTALEVGPGIGLGFRPDIGRRDRPIYKPVPPKMDFEKKAIFDDRKIEAKPEPKASPVLFQEHDHGDHGFVQDIDPHEAAEYTFMSGPLVIVTSTKPFDRKKLLKAQVFQPSYRDPFGDPYRPRGLLPPDMSMLFLTDKTVMLGVPWELARYSEHMARKSAPKEKPMQAALALAAQPHALVMGGHVPASLRRVLFMPRGGPDARVLAPMVSLFQTEMALAVNIDKSIDVTAHVQAATEISAEQSVQTLKNLRVLAELAIEKSNDAAEPGGWKLVLQKRLTQAINTAVIEQKGTLVSARIKMELDPILVKQYTKEIVKNIRTGGDRTQTMNHLKMIGLALHSYHDANKRLPPAGLPSINDPNGKPLLSWRVAILPYIEQQQLYQQFDLTQPWDHPTNKKLIARMPFVYTVPGVETKEGETHLRVLVGPTTMFEPGLRLNIAQVQDGTSNTIMAIEAADPTIWTKPDDLPYNPQGPLPKFGTSPDGFHVVFGDGSVRFVRASVAEQTLRAYITRNGGEAVGPLD